jgi:CRISPR/Cas system CSM-associated protein Csm3 (group 7 of RAMP superfamily)
MKPFELVLTFPTGGVLIGGYSAVPDGMHASHAVDRHGRPMLPATALRGALRETLEALLRGAGEPACAGGDGVDPGGALAAPARGPPVQSLPVVREPSHRARCR